MCYGKLSHEANEMLRAIFNLWRRERARKPEVKAGDEVQMLVASRDGGRRYIPVRLVQRTAPHKWTVAQKMGAYPHTKTRVWHNVVLKEMCRMPRRTARAAASRSPSRLRHETHLEIRPRPRAQMPSDVIQRCINLGGPRPLLVNGRSEVAYRYRVYRERMAAADKAAARAAGNESSSDED